MSAFQPDFHIEIRQADFSHVAGVASLHLAYIFDNSASGDENIKRAYLAAYYRELIEAENGLVVVAVLPTGNVVGYAALTNNHLKLMFKVAGQSPQLLWHMASEMGLGNLVRYAAHKIAHEAFGGKWHGGGLRTYENAYELRSVAVACSYRSAFVGTRMLTELITQARRRNLLPIIAWVGEENMASRHLFEHVSFSTVGTRSDPTGRVMLYYLAH